MDEPYRTLLGHFRHEIGHYYQYRLIGTSPEYLQRYHELFGDPEADYQAALDRHYSEGAPAGWEDHYVSSYATMHPAEDWAETFAHYLHIRDALQTAASFGLQVTGPKISSPEANGELAAAPEEPTDADSIQDLVADWLALTYALNAMSRSLGNHELYPFVLAPEVIDKLRYVHQLISEGAPD